MEVWEDWREVALATSTRLEARGLGGFKFGAYNLPPEGSPKKSYIKRFGIKACEGPSGSVETPGSPPRTGSVATAFRLHVKDLHVPNLWAPARVLSKD